MSGAHSHSGGGSGGHSHGSGSGAGGEAFTWGIPLSIGFMVLNFFAQHIGIFIYGLFEPGVIPSPDGILWGAFYFFLGLEAIIVGMGTIGVAVAGRSRRMILIFVLLIATALIGVITVILYAKATGVDPLLCPFTKSC
jgi:hypothetical protein